MGRREASLNGTNADQFHVRPVIADSKVSGTYEGKRVLCDAKGSPLTQKEVQGTMRRVSLSAQVKPGVHILRHTFCSHLAMRGAPVRAIQQLAGHQDLATTHRYLHLSPAALDAAIRLLDSGQTSSVGNNPEAAGTGV